MLRKIDKCVCTCSYVKGAIAKDLILSAAGKVNDSHTYVCIDNLLMYI